MTEQDFQLKEIFFDILNGYSESFLEKEIIYIKHFGLQDYTKVNSKQLYFYKLAIEKNLKSEEILESKIIKQNLWNKKSELAALRQQIDIIDQNLKKNIYRGQSVFLAEDELVRKKEELSKLMIERANFIGPNIESFVYKKVNEFYVLSSIYEDSSLITPKYKLEDLYNIDDDLLDKLILIYNKKVNNFDNYNLKVISLTPNFFNLFNLCDNNPFTFYGKCLVNLTFYQVELFSYGKYYKSMIENIKTQPPDDVRFDPDKLEEWYEMSVNAQKVMEQSNMGGKVNGGRAKPNNLGELAKAKGGNLSMNEVMKAYGVPGIK